MAGVDGRVPSPGTLWLRDGCGASAPTHMAAACSRRTAGVWRELHGFVGTSSIRWSDPDPLTRQVRVSTTESHFVRQRTKSRRENPMGNGNRLGAIIATSGRLLALPNFAGLGNGSPKPISEEEADGLTLAQKVARMEQIGDTCIQIDTHKKDFILAHAGEIRSFLKMFDNQGKSSPALTPDGQPIVIRGESVHTKKRAVKLLFNASLGYLYKIVYPKGHRPKEQGEAKKEGKGEGKAVEAEVVKMPATVPEWVAFFSRLTQEQRQAAYEAISKLMEYPAGNDPNRSAECEVALGYAADDAVDPGAFRPAVAFSGGTRDGCEAQQKEACGEAAVPEQEPQGSHCLAVTDTADASSLPCATPGHKRGGKYPPVSIVLEDGRRGYVVAGMGERTKRTMYSVRLEDGGRAEVRKRLYAAPANLAGFCLVPKASLVGCELPLEKVPGFLKGKVPVQESGGGEY